MLGLEPENMTYQDILEYQNGMAQGRWSISGRELKPSTCNPRADEATFYLMWLADCGYRGHFKVDSKLVRFVGPGRKRGQLFLTRTGRLPIGEHGLRILALPQKPQVLTWLSALKRRRGKAKMLACRYIIETGARLHETCALRVQQWPSAAAIDSARRAGRGFVNMTLKVTKGGKPRTIQLKLDFAALVRDWIDRERSRLVPPRLANHGTLFVSDCRGFEGTALTRSTIYLCFKLEIPGGPEEWYPHLGRHWFACTYVLEGLTRDAAAYGHTLPSMKPDWVTNRASFWLDTLRRQLGHISETTTELYLRWLVTMYQMVDVARGWGSFLDGEDIFP
ncbi:site-specific integrase [Mesorhizobium carmichaelinearum]|uniref:site-specific integrase n=1 Tax=Mesorhizobium carmichaelinearum TaxID=1208188 RepID=UPI0015CEBE27|nr:site-specific integrase [Mesorhizobium carmichaelinearum]